MYRAQGVTETASASRPWTWGTHRWWHDLTWCGRQTYHWFFALPNARDGHRRICASFAVATARGDMGECDGQEEYEWESEDGYRLLHVPAALLGMGLQAEVLLPVCARAEDAPGENDPRGGLRGSPIVGPAPDTSRRPSRGWLRTRARER